jgi:hypothetical protein
MPKPLKYSGKRLTEYTALKEQPRRTQEQKAAYQAAITRLNRNEKIARTTAARIEKERKEFEAIMAEGARREATRLRKLEERRTNRNVVVDIIQNAISDDDVFTVNVVNPLMNALNRLVGQSHAYVQLSVNGELQENGIIAIDRKAKDGATIYYDNIKNFIIKYVNGVLVNAFQHRIGADFLGDLEIRDLDPTDVVRLVVIKADKIPSQRVVQKYLDGAVHCVIEPLYNLWKKMADKSESDSTKKRYMQIARKLKSYESEYATGVPESKMEEIAKACHRCIIIHDIIGNEVTRYNPKSSKDFHFSNTRINHLEPGYITHDGKYEPVTTEQLIDIMYEHDRDDVFYLYEGDAHRDTPQSIRSVKGAWAVFNENHDIFTEFSKSLGINNYGLNAVKHKELNEFVFEGRLINSCPTPLCDEPNNLEGVKHIDIKAAYTQHKKSAYYRGFLGHITHWCKLNTGIDFVKSHLGIYRFEVLNEPPHLLEQLGVKTGKKYTLPGPEIEYFCDLGLEVRITGGCWGSKFDIEYTDEMLAERRYCTWAGKLGMDKPDKMFTFKGKKEWVGHLKSVLGDDRVMYFSNSELIVVRLPKKSYYTKHHILAFITSYTRLNMLNIMSKIDEPVKVIMDGIYFRGEMPDIEIPHTKDKEMIKHIGFRDAWYYPSNVSCSTWGEYDARFDGPCVLAGAGGTGKSYSVLANKSIIDPLYVVPSHVLGRKGKEQYGCNYTTINRLIGADTIKDGKKIPCRSYLELNGEPGVIFIDEMTMTDGEWIKKAVKMYPNSLMFVAGDIDEKQWYQCRNGSDGRFNSIWIPRDWRYVYYTEDMRSKDIGLQEMKRDVRAYMREVFTDGGKVDAAYVNLYVRGKYPTIPFEEATAMTQEGDIWLSGTHKTNDALLEKGICSGVITADKEVVYDPTAEGVKRGSFTVHSFQGLTIRDKRVFVSLDFFEYAMLYTAISRVCRLDQLVLVAPKLK